MKIYIRPKTCYSNIVLYVLKIIEINKGVKFEFVNHSGAADLLWDHLDSNSVSINYSFYTYLKNNPEKLDQQQIFKDSLQIKCSEGKTDLIATIFYMINCIQEINSTNEKLDDIGRFKYSASYQKRFNSIEENTVQKAIDEFITIYNFKHTDKKSTFFLSHDIDSIHGSSTQDGLWALKNKDINGLFVIISNILLRKHHWKNIDKILQINDEYDVKSTFFWLMNKGKCNNGIKNADYQINDVKKLISKVKQSNSSNGLHKSTFNESFDKELVKGNINEYNNRYHYLKFNPHLDWEKISNSKIQLDTSLGFAEHYGFRNSYGKSFQPFNIVDDKPYNFISTPLVFMDRTFDKYLKFQKDIIGDTIISFYEKHNMNCDLSLLWHNNYFTNYKFNSFIKEYKKVLQYLYDNKIETLSPKQIIDNNTLIW